MPEPRFDLIYTPRMARSRKECDMCRRWIAAGSTYLEGVIGGGGVGAACYPWHYHVGCVPEQYRPKERVEEGVQT